MGKRNHVTADLRISAEAQLSNSRSFINQLQKIVNEFDFGDKMTKQLVNAQEELKRYNKVLEKVQTKSVISDDELKDLVKAGDAIANIVAKTEKLYSGLSTSQWQKFSREYIAQVKAQEQAVLKIKEEYQKKTGKVYDKEIANYDKLLAKNKELKAQREQLAKTGVDDLVNKQIEQLNQKLDKQKEKLEDIINLRERSAKAFQNAANKVAQDNGFVSYANLKGTKTLSDSQVQRQLGTEKYNQEKQSLSEMLRLIKEIEQDETDINTQNELAINIAKRYNLENIKDLNTLKEQYRIRKDILSTFSNDKSRYALRYETELNARLREQQRIREAITAAENAGLVAQNRVINQGGYASKQSLNASYSATNKSVANLQYQLTETGVETIINNATNTVNALLRQIDADIKISNGELSDMDATNKKLATQSERAADEQDVKAGAEIGVQATKEDGAETRRVVEEKVQSLSKEDKDEIMQNYTSRKAQRFSTMATQSIFTNGQLDITSPTYNSAVAYETQLAHLDSLIKNIENVGDSQLNDFLKEIETKVSLIRNLGDDLLETAIQEINLKVEKYQTFLEEIAHQPGRKSKATERKKKEAVDYINLADENKVYLEAAHGLANKDLLNQVKHIGDLAGKGKIKQVREEVKSLVPAVNQTANSIRNASQQTQLLGSTFDDIKNKIGYFLSLNYVFDQMTRKITEAVNVTKEMDKDMTQIGLVLGKTSGQVWKNFDTYSKMADRLNTTTSEVTQSMKLFYQQGLNTSEVNKMVEASAIAAALGESTMAEASETLTSILNSYNLTANDALMVTDKISQIAIVSAADFGELSTAIEKVASSAASAGLDLDHMMGYLAKMIETTREAPTNIGTALKTIVANFTQFKEDPSGLTEEGSDINKVDKALKSVGISLTNANGEVRDLGEVIDELGGKWENLNRNQKAYLATAIAGTRQQSRFYALMNDYERTLELVTEGSNSAGKAQEQFALYSNSLEASTNRLTNQWQNFFNEITQGNGVLVHLYDFLAEILKVLTKMGPLLTAGGLTSFIAQARKAINVVNKVHQNAQNIGENSNLFTQLTSLSQDSDGKFSKHKVNKNKDGIRALLESEKMGNIDLNNLPDALKIEGLRKEIENLNLEIADLPFGMEKFKTIGAKAGKQVKKGLTTAKVATQAFGKALAVAAMQMAAMWVASKVFELISGAVDAAVTSAEELAEMAEESNEKAENVQALRDEYAELANTVDRTADQEKRLKEITEEVTKVSAELGSALTLNIDAFKDNIAVMDDYIARQNKIAGEQKIAAALKTAKEENDLTSKGGRWINTTFGDGYNANAATTNARSLYSEVESGLIQSYNLNSEQSSILQNYSAALIDNLNNTYTTAEEWLDGLTDYHNQMTTMTSYIASLTTGELDNYKNIQTQINDKTLSYSEIANIINDANIDNTIKSHYQNNLNTARAGTIQSIVDNTGISNSLATELADILPRDTLQHIFNPDNFGMLSEQEQKQYFKGIASIFEDDSLKQQILNAVATNGTAGLQEFIQNLNHTEIEALDIIQETIAGLETLEEQVELAKNAFEKLSTLLEDGAWTGKMSQMDIISGLINGTYNIQDISTIGNSNLLSLDLSTLISQTDARFNELKAPFKAQQDALQEQIDFYSNYGNALVEQAENEFAYASEKRDEAEKKYNESWDKYEEATQDYIDTWNEMKSLYETDKIAGILTATVIGAPIGLGMYTGTHLNMPESERQAILNEKNAAVQTTQGEALSSQREYLSSLNEVDAANEELKEAYLIRRLIYASEQDIIDIARERGKETATQLAEEKNWYIDILDVQGKVIGKTAARPQSYNGGENFSEEEIKKLMEEGQISDSLVMFYEDYSDKSVDELKEIRDATKQYAKDQVDANKDIQSGYQKTLNAIEAIQEKTTGLQKKYLAVFESFASAGQVYGELEKVAVAYELCDKGASGYFDVAQAIANDPSLIEALDLESQYLEFDRQKVIELAKTKVQTQIQELETRLEGTNAIIGLIQAQIDAGNAQTVAEAQNLDDKANIIASAAAYNEDLSNSTKETVETEGENLEISVLNWQNWQNAIIKIMQNVENQRAKIAKGMASGETAAGSTTASVLTGITVHYDAQTGVSTDEIKKTDKEEYDSLLDTITSADNSSLTSMLESYQKQKTILEKSIGSLRKYQFEMGKNLANIAGVSDSGGSEDSFEPLVEKLEHFYNYLRQIEELEAKINKIREKRNLIDATQNYYIDDLKEENELLRQQSILYGNYIDDEKEYLAELRSALSSAYSDWVYFTNDGLVQVKQTEFAINSEEEEERYNAFSELLDEYQNEYNTMLENQNTLYSIQSTMVENINSMYDKMLQRLNDVTERLEYINSISEHKVTMNFGSINKLPLLSEQIKTTTDMLLFADDAVKRLEGDFATLTDLVSGSAFKDLLTWDETLQKFIVNNAKMNSETQAQYEAQGYNWEDIVSWVESVAAASQKVTDSLQESNGQLMDAREALKDLLEERISTIDEIFEKATDEMNKFYGIYESKIESLGTENDLFGVKSENLDKQFEYLTQTATHAKALLSDLKDNNQMILNTLMQDYGQYVDMIDGVAYINKMAIEESDSLTESQRADLLQLYQLYYDSNDQIEELNDKFYDYISQIEELEEAKRDAIIDLKQQVHDELMRLDQEEIDDLSEKYAKMNALDNEYYSKLQQRISDARDARSKLQDQQNLTQMQNRLSVLQQDNSGQYNSELVELQRQINEQLQAQADTNVDLEMERIAREQQQREEDRQMQITQMENLLTFKDENGIYWQETQGYINEGNATVIGLLASTDEFKNQSQEAQQKNLEELQDLTETASAGLQTGSEYIASNFREDLKEFVNAPVTDVVGTLSQAAADNKEAISGAVAEGTSVFINTMKGLFEYLAILTGKTTDKGYNTGNLSASGIYTMPTKEPPKPPVVTTPPPATNTSSGNGGTVGVGSRVKASSGARIYTSSTGSRGGSQYYANDPIYKVLQIIGNRALVRHHKLSSGYTGWFNLSDLTAYKKGGYVNFTGPAWVDGTNSSPEAFLNAKQTALFETLRDALVKMPNINSGDGETGDNITIENLTIDVKELADTDSIDKVVKTVKDSIYRDATSGNNMKINRRR